MSITTAYSHPWGPIIPSHSHKCCDLTNPTRSSQVLVPLALKSMQCPALQENKWASTGRGMDSDQGSLCVSPWGLRTNPKHSMLMCLGCHISYQLSSGESLRASPYCGPLPWHQWLPQPSSALVSDGLILMSTKVTQQTSAVSTNPAVQPTEAITVITDTSKPTQNQS